MTFHLFAGARGFIIPTAYVTFLRGSRSKTRGFARLDFEIPLTERYSARILGGFPFTSLTL
jgi:hypothetical protein